MYSRGFIIIIFDYFWLIEFDYLNSKTINTDD